MIYKELLQLSLHQRSVRLFKHGKYHIFTINLYQNHLMENRVSVKHIIGIFIKTKITCKVVCSKMVQSSYQNCQAIYRKLEKVLIYEKLLFKVNFLKSKEEFSTFPQKLQINVTFYETSSFKGTSIAKSPLSESVFKNFRYC